MLVHYPSNRTCRIHRGITDRGDKPAWNLSARARESERVRGLGCLSLAAHACAVRVDKDRKNLPSSLSFALTEFRDASICNNSMVVLHFIFHIARFSNCTHIHCWPRNEADVTYPLLSRSKNFNHCPFSKFTH